MEAGLDLTPAFTALNLAAEFYRNNRLNNTTPDENARALRNMRKRLRELKQILADADIPDAKKVKKIRFVVPLLLPEEEQPREASS